MQLYKTPPLAFLSEPGNVSADNKCYVARPDPLRCGDALGAVLLVCLITAQRGRL